MNAPAPAEARETAVPAAARTPMVSVIMPVYNGARTLRAAIDSVLAQTFQDFEFIVVDDASTDDSAAIVRSYGDRIRFVRRPTNSGKCAVPRTEALQISSGRYWAFIDQDDGWQPRKLEMQTHFMETHPEFAMSHTYAWLIDGDGENRGVRHQGLIPPSGPCARELLAHCFITTSTLMMRRRGFTPDDDVHLLPQIANSDYLFFFRELQISPAGIGFIPEPLASYRQWPGSMSHGRWKWSPEDVPALLNLRKSRLWRGLVSPRDMRQAIAHACLLNAQHHADQGRFGRTCYFALHGWPRAPMEFRFGSALLKSVLKSELRTIRLILKRS